MRSCSGSLYTRPYMNLLTLVNCLTEGRNSSRKQELNNILIKVIGCSMYLDINHCKILISTLLERTGIGWENKLRSSNIYFLFPGEPWTNIWDPIKYSWWRSRFNYVIAGWRSVVCSIKIWLPAIWPLVCALLASDLLVWLARWIHADWHLVSRVDNDVKLHNSATTMQGFFFPSWCPRQLEFCSPDLFQRLLSISSFVRQLPPS